jgi:predicted DNA-binding helix-hairpin-helix protein
MGALDELKLLTSQMKLEPAEDVGCPRISNPKQDAIDVFNAQLPNGKTISLLKTLLTSACEHNCNYCPFRSGRDFRRGTLKPDEMAQVFNTVHRAGIVEGIFLSSGIAGGGIRTQDRIIATAEILRKKYNFQGYIHLKLMPGSERAQVERTMHLADRVSLNLEAPNTLRLQKLAPDKIFEEELFQPLRWVDEIRRTTTPHLSWRGRWPSMTTQFVVGAVGESDLELLTTTSYMHENLHLGRAYFSSFEPTPDTPFEDYPPASTVRGHRLYQASFLLRDYGYDLEELPFEPNGNLPENTDPKMAWARSNLLNFPVEINNAERQDLLKVPGIGPKSAEKILQARRQGVFHQLEDLHKIGVNSIRAAPFILLDGKQPHHQLSLW